MTLGGGDIPKPPAPHLSRCVSALQLLKQPNLVSCPQPPKPRPASCLYPTLTALSMNRLSPQSCSH